MRRPSGRRALLPAEADLCNAIGLSEEEYWHFVELTEAYNGKRSSEYELVPAIHNDATTIAIISLVIGVASTAVSLLLSPKPRTPQFDQGGAGPQLKTADIQGQKRFAPQTGFDSVQELATLGNVIPLIFTRKGIRVVSQLLWSQMLSYGTSQQLRALMLFGHGKIEQRPDFAGFAIGDLLLENYTSKKIALYFKQDGGRIVEGAASGDRYSESLALDLTHSDAFGVFWDSTDKVEPYFSGSRNPSTQTEFGIYSPMPNGMKYKVNYELVLIQKSSTTQAETDQKRKKVAAVFPRRAAVTAITGTSATYTLDASTDDGKGFEPWKTEDVKASVESSRIDADEAITVGDQYMLGSALYACSDAPSEPWEIGITKQFSFQLVPGESGKSETAEVLDVYAPYERLTITRAAIGAVSNNRKCYVTEIGLRSTVWKQINGFANVNSQPDAATIADFEQRDGSISLGGMSKYIKRFSFFTLQARKLGTGATWTDLSGDKLFCIKGQTPQPQYNYIRIVHPYDQYEFRLRPYPGNLVYQEWLNKNVYWLRPGSEISYSVQPYTVVFSGQLLKMTPAQASNSEWVLGEPPEEPKGEVVGVSPTQSGTLPVTTTWKSTGLKGTVFVSNIAPYGGKYSYYSENKIYLGYKVVGNVWSDPVPIFYQEGFGTLPNSPFPGRRRYVPLSTVAGPGGWYTSVETEQIKTEAPVSTTTVNAVGGSGTGLTFTVNLYSNGATTVEVANPGTGYVTGEQVFVPTANLNVTLSTDEGDFIAASLNPYDAISDYVLYDAENASHMDGPEHSIVYLNEQIEQTQPDYNNLAYAGIRINSSKEWASFSSLSAYFKKGIVVERLTTTGSSATNLLPEIAYALLTDKSIGAGEVVGTAQVDKDRMTLAAKFCQANGFTWDGVITERQALRQWIFEQAGYCLLDFTILGGRFSLVPSVPYNSDYTIDFDGKPPIKALFTDGNIRNLKVSFLSPEERQLFRATCMWRDEKENGFAETRVISVNFQSAYGGSDTDPEEVFDMSGFCTTQEHALTFAKYALKVRKEVDHGLTFETTPQAAMNLAPGEYFRLVSEATHTSRFNNGSIGPDGTIQSKDVLNGSYSILYWAPGTVGVQSATLTAVNGKTTQSALFGVVFAISNTTTTNRVYKVETLSYAEDGLVEVAASHAPLTSSGSLAILDWGQDEFDVEVG